MTELAALNIRITGDSGELTTAVNAAKSQLGTLNGAMTQTQTRAGAMGGALGGLASRMQGARGQIQNVAFQLQDMAVQLTAGTSASVVFAQQGSQIASAFGPVGAVIGALAAVGIPALAYAFSSGGEAAKTFAQRADEARTAIENLKAITELYSGESMGKLIERYGQLDAALAAHIQRMREVAEATALANTQAMINQLVEDLGGLNGLYNGLADTFNLLEDEAIYLGNQLRFALSEEEPKKQIVQLENILRQLEQMTGGYDKMNGAQQRVYDNIVQSVDQLRILTATQPDSGWLSSAISQSQALASSLWDAVAAKFQLSNGGTEGEGPGMTTGNANWAKGQMGFTRPGQELLPPQQGGGGARGGGGGGGGGGGAGVNPLQAELEALQQSLLTQEQLQMESYTRQQEMLKQALDQRLITQQEYARMMEQVEGTHAFQMQKTTNQGVQQTLGHLGTLFQGSKKIGAAIALANSYLAFTEVLKDPFYIGRPFARFAAAGAALASGLQAVRSIKSASPGGGGGGGGMGAQSLPAQQNVQTLNFNVQNDSFGIGANLIRQIAAQLNEAQRNGSTLIRATVV